MFLNTKYVKISQLLFFVIVASITYQIFFMIFYQTVNATLLGNLMWDQSIENQDIDKLLESENITTNKVENNETNILNSNSSNLKK